MKVTIKAIDKIITIMGLVSLLGFFVVAFYGWAHHGNFEASYFPNAINEVWANSDLSKIDWNSLKEFKGI